MKVIILITCMFVINISLAQQDPLYSQYINNPFVVNPAYGGMNNNLSATLNYRYQWTGFEGSPKTVNASAHISLMDNRMGAGFMVISDRLGAQSTTEFFGTYSYRLPLNKKSTLAFGLQGGVATYQTENSKLNPQDPTDPLFQGTISKTTPNLGAGLILSSDRYFLSLSVPRMLENSLQQDNLTVSQYSRHLYLMWSYLIYIGEHLRLRPSILYKGVQESPASVDLNAAFIIHENYQAGILTRNFNTYGLFGQAILKDAFRIGYVLEVPMENSVGTNFITHEIMIGFRMNAMPFHSNSSIFSF